MPSFRFTRDVDVADLRGEVREMAIGILVEGLRLGEDRLGWTLDVTDAAGQGIMSLTLAEAVAGADPQSLQ